MGVILSPIPTYVGCVMRAPTLVSPHWDENLWSSTTEILWGRSGERINNNPHWDLWRPSFFLQSQSTSPTSGSAQGQKQTGSTVWPGNLACWGLPNLGPQTRSAGPGAWTSHTQKEQLSCSPTNWGTRLPDPLNHSAWLGKFGSYVKWAFSQSCPGMSLSWSPTHNRAWLPVLYERKGWQEYLEAS